MTQNDARNFLMALNALVPYVPPMLFQPVVSSPVARLMEAIANGQVDVGAVGAAGAKANGHAGTEDAAHN